MLRLSDARNFGRTFTGLTLVAGPVLLLIAQIVAPDVDDDHKVKELADVAASKSSYIVSAIIFFLASLVLLGASVGVIRLFRERRVTLGQIAGGLLALGSGATMAFYAFQSVEYEMATESGLDRAQMAKLLDKGQEAASGLPIIITFVLGIVLGLILLAIAAWRRRVAPPWAAPAIAAGGVLSFFGESKPISIVAFVLLTVGLGSLGMAVLSMSDDEWDALGAMAGGAAQPPPPTPAAAS